MHTEVAYKSEWIEEDGVKKWRIVLSYRDEVDREIAITQVTCIPNYELRKHFDELSKKGLWFMAMGLVAIATSSGAQQIGEQSLTTEHRECTNWARMMDPETGKTSFIEIKSTLKADLPGELWLEVGKHTARVCDEVLHEDMERLTVEDHARMKEHKEALRAQIRERSAREGQKQKKVDFAERVEDFSEEVFDKVQDVLSTVPIPMRVHLSLYIKAHKTFKAIRYVINLGLEEDGHILLRSLVEALINFRYLGKALGEDVKGITLRVGDAYMLDTIRRMERADFQRGTLAYSAEGEARLIKAKEEITARYGKKETAKLLRHGFSGLPVSERAEAVGLKQLYDVTYRIASRNVHSMDVFEQGLFPAALPKDKWLELKELRWNQMMGVSSWCMLQFLGELGDLLGVIDGKRLASLQAEYDSFYKISDGRSA